ncbi:hypothetical protein SERLA73DRAFT_71524 [Serpula lacrymans var. lacrymans S7.3]|uniref:Uncharacterized protein n=2 Tax=Serpula lacrymans var. lacrymans TaxID=341189 RepID=F8PRB2_SERL3|nr:uncharacterized protein SERLADRAFT_435899 [Serpula lacrymans var. lacrymans S7.9]EGO02403.1 hypothetical protein SERLA73DRAFT_71524 [Serpula lacrymans var. lacrymans S7.3]EGO28129.1 hypothetical protein SERLADRAFT_435899 [Serpula lacrymans var. lacrymans S7.9]
MPGPAVYVVAVVVGLGACVMFKDFVYEPHIAPTLERWAQDFVERRRARRQREQVPVSVSVNPGPSTRRARSNDGDSGAEGGSVYELEGLISREVDEWRNKVDRSQNQLRFRNNAASEAERYSFSSNTLDESIASLPYTPIVPTHVVSNDSSPMTATLSDLHDVFVPTTSGEDTTPWDLHIGSSSLSRTVAPSDDHRAQSQPSAVPPPSLMPSVRSPLSQTPVIPSRASTLTPTSAAAQTVLPMGSQPIILSPAPIIASPSAGYPAYVNSPHDNPFESPFDAAVSPSTPRSPGRTFSQSPEILFRSSPSPPLDSLQRTPPQYLGSLSERYPAPVSPPIEIYTPVHSPIELVSPPSTRSGTPPVDIFMPMSPGAETFSDFLSPTMSSVDFLSAAEEWEEDSDDEDLSVRSPSPEASPRHNSNSASLLWSEYHHPSGSDDGHEGSVSEGSETSSWASVPPRR